ncbi:MAG: 4Fe-4S binding protein [Aeriscardovia sp.]|nr:4Fe-4S binding protein [uncultured Butyrivibrio sp.]MBR4414224.1 4Fe-4S binding protein [Aeriscardovia sp.]
MKSKFIASVDENVCVCCGACHEACPTSAISTPDGCYAEVSTDLCVGCGKCSRICPTGCISIINRMD